MKRAINSAENTRATDAWPYFSAIFHFDITRSTKKLHSHVQKPVSIYRNTIEKEKEGGKDGLQTWSQAEEKRTSPEIHAGETG